MEPKFYILHDIPGRIRLQIPALIDQTSYQDIENMFSSIKGIQFVRIQPIIHTMLIEYNSEELSRNNILRYVSIFFHRASFDPFDPIMVNIKPRLRNDLFRSLVTGVLLLVAYMRRTKGSTPDVLDYISVISTGYTVISHGTNRLSHPDVLTGIISLISLGASNMLQVSIVTWAVNALELLYDLRRNNHLTYV
ncbi:HMA2 domain-containing protein [Heyndrickxia sp. NPDC080065]|uniref:HMA2 domain-containing protein n=1 Tax=Heyndrickxia sp. NPDC080065 TaxID=3390568 RepID=UPI003D02CBDB